MAVLNKDDFDETPFRIRHLGTLQNLGNPSFDGTKLL